MATSFSKSPFFQSATSRYMMAIHSTGTVNEVFTMFFDTIAEARKAVALNLGFAFKSEDAVRDPLNGFSVANLPAELVKARTKRYGALTIAHHSGNGATRKLDLLSLR